MIKAKGPEAFEALCAKLHQTWPPGIERRTMSWPLTVKLYRR